MMEMAAALGLASGTGYIQSTGGFYNQVCLQRYSFANTDVSSSLQGFLGAFRVERRAKGFLFRTSGMSFSLHRWS